MQFHRLLSQLPAAQYLQTKFNKLSLCAYSTINLHKAQVTFFSIRNICSICTKTRYLGSYFKKSPFAREIFEVLHAELRNGPSGVRKRMYPSVPAISDPYR